MQTECQAAPQAKRGRGLDLTVEAGDGGEDLVASQGHGLGGPLLRDQLLVGRLPLRAQELGVAVGDDLIGIPKGPVFASQFVDRRVLHGAECAAKRHAAKPVPHDPVDRQTGAGLR